MAVVNCLNFGNPEHPEVMWQLSEAIDGMTEACLALGSPGHRRQREPLQRERRRRHRPHAGHRRARPDRPAGRPPARGHPGRGRPRWSCSTPVWAPPAGRRNPPSLAGSRWAVERRGHRNGTLPALDLPGPPAAGRVRHRAGGRGHGRRWRRRRPAARWWPGSTTSPAAASGWPWPSWPSARGSGCRWPAWPTTTSCSPRRRPGWWCAPPAVPS